MRNYDIEFLKRFSLVIGFLALLTLGLILVARHFHGQVKHEQDPSVRAHLVDRISPVGAVYAGATGAAAQAAAAAAAAQAAAANVPFDGRVDGEEIYTKGPCAGCHTAGVAGAPTLSAGGIGARVAQKGIDLLFKHAIEGFTGSVGMMPAKGGNPALTEEQIHAAVTYMVDQSK